MHVLNERFGSLISDPVPICVAWIADLQRDDRLILHEGSKQFTEAKWRDQGLADVQVHYALVPCQGLCQYGDAIVSQHVFSEIEPRDSKFILPHELDQLEHRFILEHQIVQVYFPTDALLAAVLLKSLLGVSFDHSVVVQRTARVESVRFFRRKDSLTQHAAVHESALEREWRWRR